MITIQWSIWFNCFCTWIWWIQVFNKNPQILSTKPLQIKLFFLTYLLCQTFNDAKVRRMANQCQRRGVANYGSRTTSNVTLHGTASLTKKQTRKDWRSRAQYRRRLWLDRSRSTTQQLLFRFAPVERPSLAWATAMWCCFSARDRRQLCQSTDKLHPSNQFWSGQLGWSRVDAGFKQS